MTDLKIERWRGAPDVEQPDVGDLLVYVDETHGFMTGPIMLVRHARPVRGRESEPHELVLLLEPGHVGHLQHVDPEQIFPTIKAGRPRRTRRRKW